MRASVQWPLKVAAYLAALRLVRLVWSLLKDEACVRSGTAFFCPKGTQFLHPPSSKSKTLKRLAAN
jgi:hypothetical protein